MPRSRRILSNQGLYHVYNRAELGQPIFESDGAKTIFLATSNNGVRPHYLVRN